MYYIIFDLEFNQYNSNSLQNTKEKPCRCPFEIIQIGAVKLDLNFNMVATFNRLVKPTIYENISPFITELTGISIDQLSLEESFPDIYKSFIEFINENDSVFCIWGMSDIKELFRNIEYHELDEKLISKMYINLQPYVSKYFKLPKVKLLRLQNAVELLNIKVDNEFHDALHDAEYTSEIFKKIYTPSIEPKLYNPYYVIVKPRHVKKIANYEKLKKQFKKMYGRLMSNK